MTEREADGNAQQAETNTFFEAYKRGRTHYELGEYQKALAIYLSVAERFPNEPDLFLHIAAMYQKAQGTNRDDSAAEHWIERAANAGLAAAQFHLAGVRFRQGRDIEARQLLESAAGQEHGPSLYHLGRLYEIGRAVPSDTAKAIDCFRRAAAKGHLLAERQLAVIAMKGQLGLVKIPLGFIQFVRGFFKTWRAASFDPSSESLQ